MANYGSFDTNQPSGSSFVRDGDNLLRSDKSTLAGTLDEEHYFNSTSSASAGVHRPGSALPYWGATSSISTVARIGHRPFYDTSTGKLHLVSSASTLGVKIDVSDLRQSSAATNDVIAWNGSAWSAQAGQAAAMSDGTRAQPALYFSSESSLGVYRDAAGTIGFASHGTRIASITSNRVLVPNGSSATKGLAFIGNGSAGLYYDGSSVRIGGNGAEYIAAAGYLSPSRDNFDSIGADGLRFSVVWAGSGTISTSARSTKDIERELTPEEGLAAVRATRIHEGVYKNAPEMRRWFPILDEIPKALLPDDSGENWISDNLLGAAVLAIRALSARIEALEAKRK